jgi:hypothetical protein
VPDVAARENLARPDVQVIAGRVRVLCPLVPEVDSDIGLVRRLVLREASVPVNAEERPAARSRIGAEMGADLLETRGEGIDEVERRIEQLFLVPVLVGSEPLRLLLARKSVRYEKSPGPTR